MKPLTLSVVIPSYNSAAWLPTTFDALAAALRAADVAAEVIVIDDGSTDDTVDVVRARAGDFPGELVVSSQPNSGRFLARWAGLQQARAETVLLLDSRVLLDRASIAYALAQVGASPQRVAWNGYVVTDRTAPLVGRFWEVPTHVFWGGFLRSPRPVDLTAETFDSAPKGTTLFLAPRDVLVDAFRAAWPDGDARFVSDDTKLLRYIAAEHSIRLDPAFSATYRPRTTFQGFVAHSFDRGTLFVDSYAGTTASRSVVLIALALSPVLLLAVLVALAVAGRWGWAVATALLAVVAALSPLVPAAVNRCPPRGLLAYIVFLPVFVVPFWAGLVRGVFVHRKSFARQRGEETP